MNAKEIMATIPARYPVLYVDTVDEIETGKTITAKKNVTINENYFQGHFPQMPVMPGVIIVEAMVQTAEILIAKSYEKKSITLIGIKNTKFRKMVEPGDVLTINAAIDKVEDNEITISSRASVGNDKACSTKLIFKIDKK